MKTGKLDIPKETAMAEAELRFQDIVGAPVENPAYFGNESNTRKPGVGLLKTVKIPKKGTKAYRKRVTVASSQIHEEEYVQKAVSK